MHMYAKVMPDQFEINHESIIHKPTGAEFTPVLGVGDSIVVWTGEIGRSLPDGEVYRYVDVLTMMRRLWGELSAGSMKLRAAG
jgi:hypothetical protein